MLKISIVIPTYNRRLELCKLLSQLNQQIYSELQIHIIVVVDGSTDGTTEMLISDFPSVIIVQGTGNWWYTKSINEGIKNASDFNPDYILCLNDDVELCENYLNKLLLSARSVEIDSFIGSISFTISKPHCIITSGVRQVIPLLNRNLMYVKPFTQTDPVNFSGIYPSVTLSGRGTLMPYKILKRLEFYDEKFVQYLSDIDLYLRAAKLGCKVYISWDAKLFIHVEKSSATSSFISGSFPSFLKSFFNKHSRNYIPSRSRFLFRHDVKWLFPLSFIFFILGCFKAFFFNKKLL